MTDDEHSHGAAQAHPSDPIVDQIDALLTLLHGWRATLVRIGDPREEAAKAKARMLALLRVTGGPLPASDPVVVAAVAETPIATAIHDALWPAAKARDDIGRTVERLHAALAEPEPSDEGIRDTLARYLDSLIEKLRLAPQQITPEAAADQMIAAVARRWPAYGARLDRHRPQLVDRMGKLATRVRGSKKGDGPSAEQLREEVLRWMFPSGSASALKGYRRRQRK